MKIFLVALLSLLGSFAAVVSGQGGGAGGVEREVVVSADVLSLRSNVLGEERTVRVVLPVSYGKTTRAYPAAYVLDGESSGFLVTAIAARFLASLGRVPEMIVVGVHNVRREDDMTPAGLDVPHLNGFDKRADAFLSFFADELFGLIGAKYRVQASRVLIGHSHGGIFGTYALAARPDVFRWHLSIDAPLYLADEWLVRNLSARLEEHPDDVGRWIAVDAGGRAGDAWERLKERAPDGFVVRRFSIEGESHESAVYPAVYQGLRALFFDYPLEEREPRTLLQLRAAVEGLARSYGAAPAPSRRALILQSENHRLMGFGKEARLLLEEAIALYGASEHTAALLAQARVVEAAGPPKETVADVLSVRRATAAAVGPFVGAWELDSPGHPRNLLRIAIDGDRATGSFQLANPKGERGLLLELDVIEVHDDGRLAFGYINNMRPKGVLYYTVERKGNDRLVGSMTFRGVTMEPRMEEFLATQVYEFRRFDD